MNAESKRFVRYLVTEREAARMYRELANLTTGERREALLELAEIEVKHAGHWEACLRANGESPPVDDGHLDPDSRVLLERAKRLSLNSVLPALEQAERDAQGIYDDEPAAPLGMANDERIHERVLAELQKLPEPDTSAGSLSLTPAPRMTPDQAREALNNSEMWHRTDKSGAFRAAIFGVSDGLVSNTALVMGFAGSGVQSSTVLFAGLAGLLAGAFSMGAGEYVSVASQKDIFRREIEIEARELQEKPEEEQRELELLYRAKGLSREAAKSTASQIMADPETALDTLAREELGLDPQSLGSPVKVAASSFAAFTIGAAVPVIPYLFLNDNAALFTAIIFAVIALIVVGGLVGRLSGLGVFKSAARQLLVGAGAAAITFVLGSLVGIGLG